MKDGPPAQRDGKPSDPQRQPEIRLHPAPEKDPERPARREWRSRPQRAARPARRHCATADRPRPALRRPGPPHWARGSDCPSRRQSQQVRHDNPTKPMAPATETEAPASAAVARTARRLNPSTRSPHVPGRSLARESAFSRVPARIAMPRASAINGSAVRMRGQFAPARDPMLQKSDRATARHPP